MTLLNSILFVDDDPVANYHHTALANKINAAREIFVKTNGEDALDFINERYWTRQTLPSVIVLDLNMPLLNGVEFIRELKASELLGIKNIPVAIVTCSIYLPDLTALGNNACGFVKKPLTEEKLLEIINNTLFHSFSMLR